ncbi:MAG: polysaccharide biosynthesis protein [Candidatus Cyclonatronum sp.]|uniref:nucleoside-diphosphate sugar epimerase/dehydratase n=1 Tax=Cyclonatronum sp. TaxID=3024185 RepID=UPI0025BE414F|nr:nucleoside-diphosphate sugar epimerase/dehydratase [Cyclonatronum sp.]MCC5933268.1 polysaccharide biosynthesis protein [Balneolales bacterium]MCH8485411.1 polysaccharide biosynthesis protein [Cyclonatronum sp.]
MGHIDAWELLFVYTAIASVSKLVSLLVIKIYKQSWHNVSVFDLFQVILITLFSAAITLAAVLYMRSVSVFAVPFGVVLIDMVLSIIALGAFRMLARVITENAHLVNPNNTKKNKRVLIVGAGSAGTTMAKELRKDADANMAPVGFLDDDPAKLRQTFVGLKVFGTTQDIGEVVKSQNVDIVLIAIPSNPDAVREILKKTIQLKVKHRILPRLADLANMSVSVSQIREVDVEDLLQRDPINLNTDEISSYLTGKTVLVTGAGGSIGSEIVRQVCNFSPARILLVGRGENSIYQLQLELNRQYKNIEYFAYITDVRDKESLARIFERHKPEILFHAAAHKHVPLMEDNPEQAVFNNIFGTKNLVELAHEWKVERFVNVSTDKAVNPTSVMGASKRAAEYVVEWGATKAGKNQVFVSVRFGNVLGSRGSVIPIFKDQIQNGGPVTVTHPEMNRYFMTIPEASQLVLQAGGMENNGAVYVLDMGKPVKISDLARDLIQLSGLIPGKDIQIEYTGMRPGEKLFEELLTAEEGTESSKYKKIMVSRKSKVGIDNLEEMLVRLHEAALAGDGTTIRKCFYEMIPNYSGYKLNGEGKVN